MKSAVTYIQILKHYSTFVQTDVSQLKSFHEGIVANQLVVLILFPHVPKLYPGS